MILYHGTTADITNFEEPLEDYVKRGFGIYFYPSLEMSSVFCLNKWHDYDSGFADGSRVYECEVYINDDKLFTVTPIITSVLQGYANLGDSREYKDRLYRIRHDLKSRGYYGLKTLPAREEETYYGGGVALDVNEYKEVQYCIFDLGLIDIKSALQPRLWNKEEYAFKYPDRSYYA